MAIKSKLNISIAGGVAYNLPKLVEKLSDGEYMIYACDSSKSRMLSQNKYLFGVVLNAISKKTGNSTADLYKFFEHLYSPEIYIGVNGKRDVIQDMKRLPTAQMSDIIDKIISWAKDELSIEIPTRSGMKSPECQELYVGAYDEDWGL